MNEQRTVQLELDHMAELVMKWKYSPLAVTSRHEQLELNLSNHQHVRENEQPVTITTLTIQQPQARTDAWRTIT